MPKRGCFVSIEGVEGVGKSTNLEFVQNLLAAAKIDFVTTREPGGTDISEKIREILLDKNNVGMTHKTELMLVFAARAQHVEQFIEPNIAAGRWVVTDRFTDSTYAYQGGGREMSLDLIKSLDNFAINSYQPDLTLLLDLPTEVGLARATRRGELDRFESESSSFFTRVRDAFLHRAEQAPERFRIIDASQELKTVQASIQEALAPMLSDWRDA
jgi:dTMP kinase